MKYSIGLLLVLASTGAMAQEWHDANQKLQSPGPATDGYYMTVGYFYKYDTIPCIYTTAGDVQSLKKGYKLVLTPTHNGGQYSDNDKTMHVFYDERFRRVRHVQRFCFN